MKAPDASPSRAAAPGPRIRPVPAVSRAVAILRLLGGTSTPQPLKTIAQELGMVTSTCLHILRALVDEGLVKVDTGTKRYSLGIGMLALARSAIDSNPLPALMQPVLDRLSRAWNVTAMGVEISGPNEKEIVVLALSVSQAPFRLHVDVGSRFPALTSATGRLFAAYSDLSDAEIGKLFKAAKWDHAPDLDAWKKEVEAVRRKGYSVDRGNYVGGIVVIAAPVLDAQGRMTHALVAASLADQLGAAQSQALAKELLGETQALSDLLATRR